MRIGACGLIAVLLGATMARAGDGSPEVAVGPQYDTSHVYVAPEDVDRLVTCLLATFGGKASQPAVVTVTPTASSAISRFIQTPVGTISLFGYKTPIPYAFGEERTGYLVADMDAAIAAARDDGADVLVAPFPDPIGRDAIIQWPGGVNMQLYWHTKAPSYPPFTKIPENRVYLSADRVDAFVDAFVRFSHGKVISDEPRASAVEIGRPAETYRRIRIESAFGKMVVAVSDGHLPYPYGRETTGYEVENLADALTRAQASGAVVLVAPYREDGREAAMVLFPGGYVAEIHAAAGG